MFKVTQRPWEGLLVPSYNSVFIVRFFCLLAKMSGALEFLTLGNSRLGKW
jgi:hypothetical protein